MNLEVLGLARLAGEQGSSCLCLPGTEIIGSCRYN